MAFVLSCTLSDRIAAVGLVASAQLLPWRWCTDQRPVPMIAFHGTADAQAPYRGGLVWIAPRPFPSIPTWAANWARRNRCGVKPIDSVVTTGVTRRTYTHCADDASVVLYTVWGGGHSWPSGEHFPEWFAGSTNKGIDASSLMWEFYQEHPLGHIPSR
jgi:polyhydroxybutyrate depolymerase